MRGYVIFLCRLRRYDLNTIDYNRINRDGVRVYINAPGA